MGSFKNRDHAERSASLGTTIAYTEHVVIGDYGGRFLAFQAETGAAVNEFVVQVKAHPLADWVNYITDWDTPDDRVRFTSANLTTLNGKASAGIEVDAFHAVRFGAKVASGSTTLDVMASVMRE